MEEVTPVHIVGAEKPIPVTLNDGRPDKLITKESGGQSLAPTTTEQEDITKASQINVNLIWETTQAMIAKAVVFTTMAAGIILLLGKIFYPERQIDMPIVFAFAFGTVIGFYFGRTNHQKTGGVRENQSGR